MKEVVYLVTILKTGVIGNQYETLSKGQPVVEEPTIKNWMDTFTQTNYKGWTCFTDLSGVLYWSHPDLKDYILHATPNWEEFGFTPIDLTDPNGDYTAFGSIELTTFNDFNQYAKAVEPFLNELYQKYGK